MRLRSITVLICFLFSSVSLTQAQNSNGFTLYQQGKKEEAKRAFDKELETARGMSDQTYLWSTLMQSAWFADETGEPLRSIRLSNEALQVAYKLKNSFMIGRSLCWLGWANSSMGRYRSAIEFYSRAVEIGAPKGKIEIVPVWGLAAQELGAIYFKMGDTKIAKERLKETIEVAREHNVLAGIAEGGTHLAEIALVEGNIDEAWRWSKEAVQASIDCSCSPFNTARARVTKAKVALKRVERKAMSRESALELIDEALQYAEKVGVTISVAEAKILLSKTIPEPEFDRRYKLVTDAFELLTNAESELRGGAESKVGELLLEQNNKESAEIYLANGLKINQEMLRQIDNVHIITTIAKLEGLKGDEKARLEKLKEATDLALSTGNINAAVNNSEELGNYFQKQGYDSMAAPWFEMFHKSIDKLIAAEENPEIQEKLERRKLLALETHSEILLKLQASRGQAPKEF